MLQTVSFIYVLPLTALLFASIGATTKGESSLTRVQAQCNRLLTKMSEAGHSHFELAALCRARIPVPVCHDALRSLGQGPWTQEHIATTCRDVQSNWHARFLSLAKERGLQTGDSSFSQVQTAIDEAMRTKAATGICTGMQLDECAQYKAREYPVKAAELEKAITLKYQFWNGEVNNMVPAPAMEDVGETSEMDDMTEFHTRPEEKFEIMDVTQFTGPNLALSVYAFFVTLIVAAALGGLVILRARRLGDVSRSRPLRHKRNRNDRKRTESLMLGTGDGEENGRTGANLE